VAEDLHNARETKKQQQAVGTLNWIVFSMDVEHQLRSIGYQTSFSNGDVKGV